MTYFYNPENTAKLTKPPIFPGWELLCLPPELICLICEYTPDWIPFYNTVLNEINDRAKNANRIKFAMYFVNYYQNLTKSYYKNNPLDRMYFENYMKEYRTSYFSTMLKSSLLEKGFADYSMQKRWILWKSLNEKFHTLWKEAHSFLVNRRRMRSLSMQISISYYTSHNSPPSPRRIN